jgi:tetratricopeptide (TPR) repeat protein
VLYQEEQDPQLITKKPPKEVQQLQAKQRRLSFGALPDTPKHSFIGRSRELLALERLLHNQPSYAVVCGQGGAGKTTLAVELARWLVRTNRFRRAAFVSFDPSDKNACTDARGMLDSLGRQLLPEGQNWSVAQFSTLEQALQPIERALGDHPTIIVLDNLESVLPGNFPSPLVGEGEGEGETFQAITQLCQHLLQADPATRLIFTSRESLPAPFDHRRLEIVLGALSQEDAKALVSHVLAEKRLIPNPNDPGDKEADIIELVEAVNRHARALVLLAPELAPRGVRATTENLHQIMADLNKKHPGNRQNSLYASVELSLRRLPQGVREQVKALAVFHGGANLVVLRMMLETDEETVRNLAAALIKVGLAEAKDYSHLRLDPALPPYLLGQMDAAEREALRSRWAEAMRALTAFLDQQRFQDARLAAQLTLLELPNLLALLAWAEVALAPEEVVDLASRVEALLARLGRPQALAQATKVREGAAKALGEWSRAQFLSASESIDRLLEQGKLPAAYTAAQQLLQRALAAGAEAYPGASYDIALAHLRLGRVLNTSGAAEEALPPLTEAQRRFQLLADAGNTSAERMASTAITERADCLTDLGRYDEAAAAYEEGIRSAEKLGDRRGVAVGKGQLGTVRLYQKRYAEALDSYTEARKTFKSLGEPGTVAGFWYQIGRVHYECGQFEEAKRAYRQALAICVQQKDLAGEARSLGELGNLYDQMGRLEEAVTFYQQSADIEVKSQDLGSEGIKRNNLANTLIKLQRFEKARHELRRAIECNKPFGHVAEPWKTWHILHDLEQATGNPQAAAEARRQAIESYLAYRRAGGASQSNRTNYYAFVLQAIQQGTTTEAAAKLAELSKADDPPWFTALLAKLQAILRGDRDPALADDPDLPYRDAVELQLLLEGLSA